MVEATRRVGEPTGRRSRHAARVGRRGRRVERGRSVRRSCSCRATSARRVMAPSIAARPDSNVLATNHLRLLSTRSCATSTRSPRRLIVPIDENIACTTAVAADDADDRRGERDRPPTVDHARAARRLPLGARRRMFEIAALPLLVHEQPGHGHVQRRGRSRRRSPIPGRRSYSAARSSRGSWPAATATRSTRWCSPRAIKPGMLTSRK